MTRVPNINRLNASLPSIEKIEEHKEKLEEVIEEPINEEWREFLTDSDKITNREFFDNPIERFVARTDYDSLVYCALIENALDTDEQYLLYLCTEENVHTLVYIWAGRSAHQRRILNSIHSGSFGDWRVATTHAAHVDEVARRMRCASQVYVFHKYLGFEWYPPEGYWD